MTYQTGKNSDVRFKVETTFGTKHATATGAKYFRASPSSGLELKKAPVLPTEYRNDGMTVQARHGSRSVDGGYDADLTIGTFDELFEAVLRGTWLAAQTITEATAGLTSITTTTSTIVAAAGSWITAGVVVGDVIRLTGHSTAANNSKNLRVLGVTALTLTVPTGDLTANAVADTAFTVTVTKRLIQGNPPVGRSFSFEEYFQDIDKSEVYKGVRITGMTLRFNPDNTIMVNFRGVGQDMEVLEGASSPYFTSPTLTTTLGLTVVDAKVRVNNTDVTDFTAFEVDFDLNGAGQAVGGSNLTPDVFVNNAKVTANISFLKSSMDNVNLYLNETTFDIFLMAVENESEPKDMHSFFFGSCKLMGSSKSLGSDNALVETFPVNIGKDEVGSPRSATMIQMNSSAA